MNVISSYTVLRLVDEAQSLGTRRPGGGGGGVYGLRITKQLMSFHLVVGFSIEKPGNYAQSTILWALQGGSCPGKAP